MDLSEPQAKRRQSSHDRLPWASVALTPLEETDLDSIHAWQNDPAIRDMSMGYRLPIQRETVREWMQGLRGPGQQNRVVYAIRLDGQAVGIVQLFGMLPFHRRAELGIYLGGMELRGAGIGYMATAILLDFAFNGLDLRKVGAEILCLNTTTLRLCRRMGFTLEGVKRQEYFSDGAYWDTHVFGLLREEFDIRLPPEARRLCRSLSPRPAANSDE